MYVNLNPWILSISYVICHALVKATIVNIKDINVEIVNNNPNGKSHFNHFSLVSCSIPKLYLFDGGRYA